jgi:O-antigen ligase
MSAHTTSVQVPARTALPRGSRTFAPLALPVAFAVAMPLTFFHKGAVVHATAWAWFLDLVVIGSLALVEPLHPRAIRYLLPYLAFLGYAVLSLAWTPDLAKGVLTLMQMIVPAFAYLMAWRLADRVDEFTERIARICTVALGLVVLLGLFGVAGIEFLSLAFRPASISLAVIFIGVTLSARSWRWVALTGVTAILVAALTGSRAATVILLLLVLCSPSLQGRLQWRILAVGLVLVAVVAVSHTEAFKNRFFFDPNASLVDAVTLKQDLNTAGRRDVWPRIAAACSSSAAVGKGIGATALIATAVGNYGESHNDYLRTYCDTGFGGSVLFWGFFLFATVRCLRRAFRVRSQRRLQGGAGLLVLAFLLFALSDNPMVYTAHFLVPLAIILGLADANWHALWVAQRTANSGEGGPPKMTALGAPPGVSAPD